MAGTLLSRAPVIQLLPPRGGMSDRIWYLKRCPLFERLGPAESQRLEANATLRSSRGTTSFISPVKPAKRCSSCAGRVKIKAVTPDGRESILAFINEGEIFGELALLDDSARNEFAEAVEASQVLAVPRDDILWLMSRRPDIALHVTKLFGFRLRRIENRLRNILFRSTRERVAALLLELIDTHGHKDAEGWEIRPAVAPGSCELDRGDARIGDGDAGAIAARRRARRAPAVHSDREAARLVAEVDARPPAAAEISSRSRLPGGT